MSLEQVVAKLVADAKASEPFALNMRGIRNDELVVDLDKRARHAFRGVRLLDDRNTQCLGESGRIDR